MGDVGRTPGNGPPPARPDTVPTPRPEAGAPVSAEMSGSEPEDADRRAAQDAAAELARMGIDPREIGLDPATAVPPHPATDVAPEVSAAQDPASTDADVGADDTLAGPLEHPTVARDDIGPILAWPTLSTVDDPPLPPPPPLPLQLPLRLPPPPPPTSRPAGAGAAGRAPVRYPQPPAQGWLEPPTGARPPFAAGTGVLRSVAWSEPDTGPGAGVHGPLSRPLSEPMTPHPAPPMPPVPPVRPAPDAEQLAQPLWRAADTYGVMLPSRWRRGVRAITFGLLAPGAAAAIEQERWLVARVRARRREPWTVGFIAGKGGVGTTTTAAGVALTLATLRTDEVTLVDARRGAGSLGRRLAGQSAPTVLQLSDGPLKVRGALGVVDGVPWHGEIGPDQTMRALEDIRRSSAFTLVDIGNDLSDVGESVLGRTDQVVLVTTTSPVAVDAARAALGRVGRADPRRFETIVIAVVCLTVRQYRRAARRLRADLGLPDRRIVAVPYDPSLAAGGLLIPDYLRAPTREAFLRLAGFVADPGPPGPVAPVPVAPGQPWVRSG